MPFDDPPKETKPPIKQRKSSVAEPPKPSFPVVDDIYDDKILTDPDHKLFSLNMAALHYKVAYVKQHD